METWQEWPAAGWSQWVGSFQPVLVAVPSSVRSDLPLCFVAEHWQMRYCHSPAVGDPLWRSGERKRFICFSSLGRWKTTAHVVSKGKRDRKEHLGRGGAMYPSLVPPVLPLNLPCPPLVSAGGFFWHSSGDNWCLIWMLGGKANEGVNMMPQPSPAHSDMRFHPHLSIPRPRPPGCKGEDPTEFCLSAANQPQPGLTESDSISPPRFSLAALRFDPSFRQVADCHAASTGDGCSCYPAS